MMAKSLSNEMLKQYEEILLEEKDETLRILAEINDRQKKGIKNGSGDSSSFAYHQADQGTDTDQYEKETYLLEQEQEKLKKINLALKRIYERTFGICEICGCEIPAARIKIIPWAKTCIECKSKEEKRKNGR